MFTSAARHWRNSWSIFCIILRGMDHKNLSSYEHKGQVNCGSEKEGALDLWYISVLLNVSLYTPLSTTLSEHLKQYIKQCEVFSCKTLYMTIVHDPGFAREAMLP